MITYQSVIKQLGIDVRKEQQALSDDMVEVSNFGECLFAQADTGIGKTLATAIAVKRILHIKSERTKKIVIATSSLSLCKDIQQELERLDIDSAILMSYRNYFSAERIDLLAYRHPELATQLLDMRAWTDTIEAYISEFGGLPEGVNISQVCQTEATKSDTYIEQRAESIKHQVIITSHAMIAVDMMQVGGILGLHKHDTTLVVDEADAFIDYLKNFNIRHFNLIRELANVLRYCSTKTSNVIEEQTESLRHRISQVKAFSSEAKKAALNALVAVSESLKFTPPAKQTLEEHAYIEEFSEYLGWTISHIARSTNVSISLTEKNKEPTITQFSPYFSRVFGNYCKQNIHSVVLMSGTLSVDSDVKAGTDWVKRELKMDGCVIRRQAYSPKRFGSLSLSLYRSDIELYEDKSTATLSRHWVDDVCHEINQLKGKTLVITSSFVEAQFYAQSLNGTVFVHRQGEKLGPSIDKFRNTTGASILISPSAHTGYNYTNSCNRSIIDNIVITRMGFTAGNPILSSLKGTPDFPDAKIAFLMQADYFMSLNRVIRRTLQIIGRGIRHEDDSVHVFIVDKRFPAYIDVTNRHAKLRNAIPPRFTEAYKHAKLVAPLAYADKMDDSVLDLTLL